MTREELKEHCEKQVNMCEFWAKGKGEKPSGKIYEEHKLILELLEQKPDEMTAEEYRQRMMQAFHNADRDELIVLCVLPTEKEFEHLEWLLKNHYKQEPCGNEGITVRDVTTAFQFGVAMGLAKKYDEMDSVMEEVKKVIMPQPKTGQWIEDKCSSCGKGVEDLIESSEWYRNESPKYCPFCGLKLVNSQESEG